jgi:hypothetical protein
MQLTDNDTIPRDKYIDLRMIKMCDSMLKHTNLDSLKFEIAETKMKFVDMLKSRQLYDAGTIEHCELLLHEVKVDQMLYRPFNSVVNVNGKLYDKSAVDMVVQMQNNSCLL